MPNSSRALIELPNAEDEAVKMAVEAQLDRIVTSPLFVDTTRVKRFLQYVVSETLAGRANLLKGYTLGIEVFDRPDNFDPQADTIVRVQAGQLRRRLDLYYSSLGQHDPVRIVIPKGAYIPKFEIREKLPAANLPEPPLAKVLPIERQDRPGIVVMTFQNLTSDTADNYFAEGLTVELINALVQFRYLRVVSRNASVLPSDLSGDLRDLAKNYGVQFALTGNVRRVKNLIRVSVNLMSTETGDHVYTKSFDRECTPDNLFEIQEEIASYVAANVGAPYGAVHRFNRRPNDGRRQDMAGYEAILKYYEMNLSPTENKGRELLEELKTITTDMPRFSSAWAVRSLLQSFIAAQCVPCLHGDRRLKSALKSAKRAIAIDPENALAYKALFVAQFHSGDVEAYRKSAMLAIALNPYDYSILSYYAVTSAFMGDWEESKMAQSAALSLIARAPRWFYAGWGLKTFADGNYEFGVQMTEGMAADSSSAWEILLGLACMGHMDRHDLAEPLLAELRNRDPEFGKHALAAFYRWNPTEEISGPAEEGWRKIGLKID